MLSKKTETLLVLAFIFSPKSVKISKTKWCYWVDENWKEFKIHNDALTHYSINTLSCLSSSHHPPQNFHFHKQQDSEKSKVSRVIGSCWHTSINAWIFQSLEYVFLFADCIVVRALYVANRIGSAYCAFQFFL